MMPYLYVFGLYIPMYWIMMLLGFLAAFLLLAFTRRYTGLSENTLLFCAFWAIVAGCVGARLLYIIVNFDRVLSEPGYFLDVLIGGGLVYYGGFIGGLIGGLIYALYKKQSYFALFDQISPSLALAQAFGRVGCFCAGCCFGRPSDAFFAVTYPSWSTAYETFDGAALLPVPLMETAFLLLLTVALVLILKKKPPTGTTGGWYCVLYGVWRFFIEFFRGDDRGTVGALSTSQFISLFVFLAGTALLILAKRGVLSRRGGAPGADIPGNHKSDTLPTS